jgi:hypothetical protein
MGFPMGYTTKKSQFTRPKHHDLWGPIIRQNPPNQVLYLLAFAEFSRVQLDGKLLQQMHMMYIEL